MVGSCWRTSSIYDSSDQTRVIKDALKTLEISTTNFSPATVHGTISKAKNELKTAESFASGAKDFYERQVARVYTKYQQLLVTNNALDFDDLLLRTTLAMRDHPQMLAELQQRFQYVMIDEYQDTNHVQYVLAHALAMKHRNICVVGDPDQSIYAWRGADIKNIMEFERDYGDAKVVRLEQNYRSTKTILAVAGSTHRQQSSAPQEKIPLDRERRRREKVKLILCQWTSTVEAARHQAVPGTSARGRPGQEQDGDLLSHECALKRDGRCLAPSANVPYQIARGVEFYNRKEIKDVLAYLRVIANPADEVSLDRIINVPTRGIGDSSVKQIQAFALAHGLTFWNTLEVITTVPGISTRATNSIKAFVSTIDELRRLASSRISEDSERGLVQTLMEETLKRSGYEAMLKKESATTEEKGEASIENVNQLITAAAEFDHENPEGSLTEYLANVSLVSDADHLKDSGGAVTLMTLHAAKGLEFPAVAIIGALEEGCSPHQRAQAGTSTNW